MYKKHEAAAIKQNFWTSFGQYMRPVPSAWNEEVNWVNYHTGIRGIYFRLDAERHYAAVSIELVAKDDLLRYRFYDDILAQKALLESYIGHNWNYAKDAVDETGRSYSRIETRLEGVSVMNENDWPSIISFLKPNIMALDAWWAEAKWAFE